MSVAHLEAKVGGFVIAATLILIAFALALGHFRFTPGTPLAADFAYTGGLQSGAAVKVSGVRVGQVGSLGLLTPQAQPPPAAAQAELGRQAATMLRVQLVLDAAAQPLLHPDTTFAVATQGVIGEAYLELIPGRSSAPLPAGVALRGVDAPRLHAMTLQVAALLDVGGNMGADAGPGAAPCG